MVTIPGRSVADVSGADHRSSDTSTDDSMRALAEMARSQVSGGSVEEVLRGVAELAKRSLHGVEDVSLTLIDHGGPRTVVFTGQLAVDLDERQYELGFGPCLDAAKSGHTVIVDTDDERSPYREFGRTAIRAGVRHTVSVGMPLTQRSIGGLNIYKAPAAPVTAAFVTRAEVLASYAAFAVNNLTSDAAAKQDATHLQNAMESSAVIGQARGVLVARDRCSPDDALDLLTRIAQNRSITIERLA